MMTHYRQLTQRQRNPIEASLAQQIDVHLSIISREVHRNDSRKTYKAVLASRACDARRAGARTCCKPTSWRKHHLSLWLEHGMSPEQIAHRLKQEQPDRTRSQRVG